MREIVSDEATLHVVPSRFIFNAARACVFWSKKIREYLLYRCLHSVRSVLSFFYLFIWGLTAVGS